MAENALYELDPIVDNPKYEGFAFVREDSMHGRAYFTLDFGPGDVATNGRAGTLPPLAPIWTPQPVIGRVRSFNDYPCVNFIIPAFSRRAADALRDFLEPNGELLPLVSSVGEYYAYNITTVADILDEERCEIRWSGEQWGGEPQKLHKIAIGEIKRYECIAEKMAGLSIFYVMKECSRTYVTQPFVDRVRKHGLEGFHFIKLWPLPEGVSWWEVKRKQVKENTLLGTKRGKKRAKGNSVVLIFPAAKTKPSRAEKKRAAKLMDELDGLLYDPAAGRDAHVFGSLEGDEPVGGEWRLFLSCPDADALVEKLRPWLTRLDWPAPVGVLKRYGEYVDPDCREEWVEL